MKNKIFSILFLLIFFLTAKSWGEEIYFKNGDRLTGVITHEDEHSITLKILGATETVIDKAVIDMAKTYPEKYAPPTLKEDSKDSKIPTAPLVEWKKTFSLGYTKTSGNTNKTQGMISTNINRKTKANEATLKFDSLYSTMENKIDSKRFYGMLRYAHSFGDNLKWYNFYKIEGNQDRFQQIDYRLIPSIGRGYWFSDTDDLKAMTELAVGYQYTNYRIENKSTGEAVLVPRLFIDKRLINKLHLSEDLTFYPSITEISHYRYRSETDLINQITERWALSIQLINEFDSDPIAPKKFDSTWMTSLSYKF